MIVRALTLAGGLAAGATTSQLPEFSQQYTQRLGGAVDALAEVVADFDASAAAEGLGRIEALDQMRGTEFIERRRDDMVRTFDRHTQLSADLDAMQGAGPYTRAYILANSTDRDVANAAWSAYKPAVPLTTEGAVFAGGGFLVGFGVLWVLIRVLLMPFRRREAPAV